MSYHGDDTSRRAPAPLFLTPSDCAVLGAPIGPTAGELFHANPDYPPLASHCDCGEALETRKEHAQERCLYCAALARAKWDRAAARRAAGAVRS